MKAQVGQMACRLFAGAFSGEVVYAVQTTAGLSYEGVAPKHYAAFVEKLSRDTPVEGTVQVRIIKNGGEEAVVATPDGEKLSVPAATVTYR